MFHVEPKTLTWIGEYSRSHSDTRINACIAPLTRITRRFTDISRSLTHSTTNLVYIAPT